MKTVHVDCKFPVGVSVQASFIGRKDASVTEKGPTDMDSLFGSIFHGKDSLFGRFFGAEASQDSPFFGNLKVKVEKSATSQIHLEIAVPA